MDVCTGALTDEVKALKLTFPRLEFGYSHLRVTA